MNSTIDLMPGDRIMLFNYRLWKDDKTTPLSVTMQPCTVLNRYGKMKTRYPGLHDDEQLGPYEDLIDVNFDNGGKSEGHFTYNVQECDIISRNNEERLSYDIL